MTMILCGAGALYGLLFFAWALCRVAALDDERMERCGHMCPD